MADERFADLVGLACHDLRTPLATIGGFAKTLVRSGELPEREERFVGMIDEAAEQIHELVDRLSLATRLVSGAYEPTLTVEDTLELASSSLVEGITVEGSGAAVETDRPLLSGALVSLGAAALRFGQSEQAVWQVEGRALRLSPIEPGAAPVLDGSTPRDLGALVARLVVERLGGSLAVEPGVLEIRI